MAIEQALQHILIHTQVYHPPSPLLHAPQSLGAQLRALSREENRKRPDPQHLAFDQGGKGVLVNKHNPQGLYPL